MGAATLQAITVEEGIVVMSHFSFRERCRSVMQRHMRLALILPLLCCLLLGLLVSLHASPGGQTPGAHAAALVSLPGHVPGLVKQSVLLEATAPQTPLQLVIGLQLRNADGLKAYVDELSRPHSVLNHHYLTSAQLARAFGPLPVSESAIVQYMQRFGFRLTRSYPNHLLVAFAGTIGDSEQAFHLLINDYRSPVGRVFYAPASDPSVPASLASLIQSVVGLDTARQFTHTPLLSSKHMQVAAAPHAAACPVPGAGYFLPGQIATAYNLTQLYALGFHGEGQTVALFELDDYVASDISAYMACFGGASVPISRILVNGGTGSKPGPGAIEVELDMELVLSAAPHLAGLRVYEASNTAAGYLAEWNQIISDAVPIVSTSWGGCESTAFAQAVYLQENALFLVAAAQGQTIFAASGDKGSNDCGYPIPTTPTVDDPASQPYVTGVGGTSLTLNSDNSMHQQGAWNDQYGATGGGNSSLWTMPSWQFNAQLGSNYSSGAPCHAGVGNFCREVPDVALDADPGTGYAMYCAAPGVVPCSASTPWLIAGGTSAAAPMWAAYIALVNEKSLHDGNFNLGFLNPLLYQTFAKNRTNYGIDFFGCLWGDNYTTGDGNFEYPCYLSYNMAAGLGTPNGLGLANDLEAAAQSQSSPRAAPASTTWYFAEGSVGGSFQEYITLLNPSATQSASVSLTYLFQNRAAVTVTHSVAPSTRSTVSANADLGIPVSAPQQAISVIVQSSVPIVAERPMYFDFRGIKSGTDVVGATNATSTTFYFAEGDSRQAAMSYYTYITILNPSQTNTAHVVITYYSQGAVSGTEDVTVGPLQRGTGSPSFIGLHQQEAIKVTSDIGIVVERPMYFNDDIAAAGGWTTGAASSVGATTLGSNAGSDWLFAEGYTGPQFQEYLVLANFTTSSATATVKLEYTNGSVQTVPVTVNPESQYYFEVNNAFAHPVSGCGCTPTPSVSAEVTAPTTAIVAERLMYFHYGPARIAGGTDAVGEVGPSSHADYAFAEGYTYTNFTEYLTLQNPNATAETVAVTLFADNTIVQQMLQLQPHSRTTVNVNSLVVPMATAYPTNPVFNGFEVSMDVQVVRANGGQGTVVAERPLYFNYFGDPGGTDVIGYTGA